MSLIPHILDDHENHQYVIRLGGLVRYIDYRFGWEQTALEMRAELRDEKIKKLLKR